jgi:hypothetical protein
MRVVLEEVGPRQLWHVYVERRGGGAYGLNKANDTTDGIPVPSLFTAAHLASSAPPLAWWWGPTTVVTSGR